MTSNNIVTEFTLNKEILNDEICNLPDRIDVAHIINIIRNRDISKEKQH